MNFVTGLSAAMTATAAAGALAVVSGAMPATARASDTDALASTALSTTAASMNSSAMISAALETQITQGVFENAMSGDLADGAPQAARAAYAQNLFQPIWNYDRQSFETEFRTAAANYQIELTSGMKATLRDIPRHPVTAQDRAEAEIAMTSAFLQLASKVSHGLGDEGAAIQSLKARPVTPITVQGLHLASGGDFQGALELLEPDHAAPALDPLDNVYNSRTAPRPAPENRDYENSRQWTALENTLQRYRGIAAQGGWRALPDGDLIEAGDRDPRVPMLRQRLRVEGYIAAQPSHSPLRTVSLGDLSPQKAQPDAAADKYVYDAELESALKAFQAHHGLKRDGVLGGNTLAALNESAQSKIARIEAAMQTEQTLLQRKGRLIRVNIPSYTAEAWTDGREDLSMKAIVGKSSTPTPVFNDEAEYIVANPRWYVPNGILQRQKLSKLRANPGYASQHDFMVYDRQSGARVSAYNVNWNAGDVGARYRLVQKAGASNALGKLKIKFPNQYSVYLHGTPSMYLFDRDERAYSSGCIRLQDPVKFASWAAKVTGGSGRDVEDAVLSGHNRRIALASKIPVEIAYDLTTIGENGEIYFWRDIYQRKTQPVQMAEPAQISSEDYALMQTETGTEQQDT